MRFLIEKDIADLYIESLKKENKFNDDDEEIIDTGSSKIIGDTEIAYKVNEFGIPIVPADWKEEDDDEYPTLDIETALDIVRRIDD